MAHTYHSAAMHYQILNVTAGCSETKNHSVYDSANNRRRCNITASLTGWVYTLEDMRQEVLGFIVSSFSRNGLYWHIYGIYEAVILH